jgi:hypothetical protein
MVYNIFVSQPYRVCISTLFVAVWRVLGALLISGASSRAVVVLACMSQAVLCMSSLSHRPIMHVWLFFLYYDGESTVS